jgi:hypothetical protein
MEFFSEQIGAETITLIYDGEDKPCHLAIRNDKLSLVIVDAEFANPKVLSAELVCHLGYGNACDFLGRCAIPTTSQLWDLNHNGPPGKMQ